MANWNTETSKSTFDATSALNNAVQARTGTREGSGNLNFNPLASLMKIGDGIFGSFAGYDVVGMKVSEVPQIKSALEHYMAHILGRLMDLEMGANKDSAFKSRKVQSAVDQYLVEVRDLCMNLVTNLEAFDDKLTDVANKWAAQTSEMSSNINSAGSGLAESVKNYNTDRQEVSVQFDSAEV